MMWLRVALLSYGHVDVRSERLRYKPQESTLSTEDVKAAYSLDAPFELQLFSSLACHIIITVVVFHVLVGP